jgi:hypothetical protein
VAHVHRLFACKTWNPPNPSRHQIWAIHHRLEPLNRPRSKRRPRGRRWTTSWSRSFTGGRPHRRLPVDHLLWSGSAIVSGQNKFPSSPRSSRKNQIRAWWPIGRVWAPSSRRPWGPRCSTSAEPSKGRRCAPGRPFIDRRPGLEWGYPSFSLKSKCPRKNQRPRLIRSFSVRK